MNYLQKILEEKDLQKLLIDAKAGDPEAQFTLGHHYRFGIGVKRNQRSMIKWWKLAAEQGHTEALSRVAMAYKLGHGVEKNIAEAVRLWKIAAEKGYAPAQCNLGIVYFQGKGIEQNKDEALRMWKLAADQGHAQAKIFIGKMYYEGDGVAQDYQEAIKWFQDSPYWLGKCYLHGHGVEQNVEKTIELWESVAEGSYAMYIELAHLYSDGIHMEPDYEKAIGWWYEASTDDEGDPTKGVPEAMYELACCYYEGKGVDKDRKRALDCFKWAIKSYERERAYLEKRFPKEPERVAQKTEKYFNAYRMAIKLGDKTVAKKLKTLAQNGEEEAKSILEEFGI